MPVVRASLPGEELLSPRQKVEISSKNQKSDSDGAAASVLDTLEGKDGAQTATFQTGASSSTKPRDLSMFTRRFHLKKTASTVPSRGPASGIQKRKKGQRPDIAVFVEKARESKKTDNPLDIGHRGADSQASLKVRSDGIPVVQPLRVQPRKRPGTGTRAVVKKKDAEQGGQQSVQPDLATSLETGVSMDSEPSQRDHGPSQLSEDLQRSTLQPSTLQQALDSATRLDVSHPASQPSVVPQTPTRKPQNPYSYLLETAPGNKAEAANPDSPRDRSPPAPTPRAKSKVPPLDFKNPYPYGPETVPGKDADAESGEDEDDYVYDTYIRQRAHAGSATAGMESLRLGSGEYGDSRKIGIIVITQEDEKLWETYGIDEGKDEDWDSEDEDENGEMATPLCQFGGEGLCFCIAAEDYHANDYPDDELDSDDEFGRGAYRHRRNASDAEEFDEETGNWSDEEAHPWNQRNPWALRCGEGSGSDDELSD